MPLSPELESYLPTFVKIESGGNPNARTGKYTGLLQMGPDEIAKYGGNDLAAGRALLADRAAQFAQKFGRQPTGPELYMLHQQGTGGYANHLANPDAPAWKAMYATAEGQQKGPAWAKQAIWGNMTPDWKKQFSGPEDPKLTSGAFTTLWSDRVENIKAGNPNATQITIPAAKFGPPVPSAGPIAMPGTAEAATQAPGQPPPQQQARPNLGMAQYLQDLTAPQIQGLQLIKPEPMQLNLLSSIMALQNQHKAL